MHFVPADREEVCHDCEEPIKSNELMMPHTIREPRYGSMRHTRVVYCHSCGLLMLESQTTTGSRTP